MVVAVAPVSGASVPISIVDNAYQPSSATVNVGDTVVWCNNGENGHSVVPDEGDFGTGALDPGECSAPFRATTLGTFTYDCSLENMRGTLTVRQAPPQTTTQRPPASTAPPRSAPPPGAPPPAGSPRTAASRSATATTGDTAGESAPPVSFVAPELADAPPPDIASTSQFVLGVPTTSTLGDIAIDEVGSDADPGRAAAVILSAAIAVLGGAYLAWHFRFGRRSLP